MNLASGLLEEVVQRMNNFDILPLSFVGKYVIVMNRQAFSWHFVAPVDFLRLMPQKSTIIRFPGERKSGKPVAAAAGLFYGRAFDHSSVLIG
jgi:hypothetical protein